ncbi:MAG: DUF3326 domain-containing protein [Candidatus Kariarchaeaceae archaeon]
MIIPTGIGCEVGGHAGDATPSARLIASICDNLIIHPNVVNASDINEIAENMWYVEGSILDRFLQGQIALEGVYSNKLLLVVNPPLRNETINSVNAARNTLGLDIEIMELNNTLHLQGIFKADGRASGIMTGENQAVKQIQEEHRNRDFGAIAIQTIIDVEEEVVKRYLNTGGVNPYGGAEAVCSRFFSREFEMQCAHAPIESGFFEKYNNVVDPRLAAEIVSVSYLHCILKGLHEAPKVVDYNSMCKDTIRIDDVDLMVSPDGCWDVPHEACANWDIPIIFVRENKNIYEPYKEAPRNCYLVDNYIEAAGIIASKKAGVTERSVRRVAVI